MSVAEGSTGQEPVRVRRRRVAPLSPERLQHIRIFADLANVRMVRDEPVAPPEPPRPLLRVVPEPETVHEPAAPVPVPVAARTVAGKRRLGAPPRTEARPLGGARFV